MHISNRSRSTASSTQHALYLVDRPRAYHPVVFICWNNIISRSGTVCTLCKSRTYHTRNTPQAKTLYNTARDRADITR